jgi:antitoxin component YwqK of YwqJK toxin-antitoxin module
MNPARLLVVLVSLPLVLFAVGCGDKKEPELEGVPFEEIEWRGPYRYHKDSDTPYTGKVFGFHENGQKGLEKNYKDGKWDGLNTIWYPNGQKMSERNLKDDKEDGLWIAWHSNGQKKKEETFKDGEPVEDSEKFWNSKGEPVVSLEEANKE